MRVEALVRNAMWNSCSLWGGTTFGIRRDWGGGFGMGIRDIMVLVGMLRDTGK